MAFGIAPVRERLQNESKNYLRQALVARALEPAVPVRRVEWFKIINAFAKNIRIPGLRGLRVTPAIKIILQAVGERAGEHGDRYFMHQRTLAGITQYSRRTVGAVLSLAVDTGLLIRHTHGAGGSRVPGAHKRQGASYQLAFPGGVEGLEAAREWLNDHIKRLSGIKRKKYTRRTRVEETSARAREFIRKNPDLVRDISTRLGRPDSREGAIAVVEEIFLRTNSKIRIQRAYVLAAVDNNVEREGSDLAKCYPPTQTLGENPVRARIEEMLAGLYKRPDY